LHKNRLRAALQLKPKQGVVVDVGVRMGQCGPSWKIKI
jgi:hypothetical protein